MDTTTCSEKGGAAKPTGQEQERRASLVIKETAERLHGLYTDAIRSDVLMAELEALLASSQAASREGNLTDTVMTKHFAAVQPLQAPSTDDTDDKSQNEVFPSLPPGAVLTARRRSSIINMDGSSIDGRYGQPDDSIPVERSLSFMRSRSSLAAKSWTDGSNMQGGMRRRTVVEAGDAPQTALPALQGGNSGDTGNPKAAPVAPAYSHENLRASSEPYGVAATSMAWPSQPGGPPSTFQPGSFTADGTEGMPDLETAGWHDADPMTGAKSTNGSGELAAGRSAPRARSGRFIKMLKGVFHTDEQRGKGALQTPNGFIATEASGQPLSPSGSSAGRFAQRRPSLSMGTLQIGGSSAANGISGAVDVHRGESFSTVRRSSGSVTAASWRPLVQQIIRYNSFQVAGLPAATAQQAAAASLAPACLSQAQSLGDQQTFVRPQQASQVPADSAAPAAQVIGRGGSRRSLVCALPQI